MSTLTWKKPPFPEKGWSRLFVQEPDGHLPLMPTSTQLVKMKFGSDATYWSGFMGDPSAGSHLRPQPTSTWEEAKEYFVRANRFGTFQLHRSGWNPLDVLPEKPYCEKAILDFDDQLNFEIGRASCRERV